MRSIRRSRAAGGFLAAALLVAVSGCGADESDPLSLPPTANEPDVADPPEATWSPTNEAFGTTQMLESAVVAATAPFAATMDDPDFVPVQWLLPWDDGFLAAGVRYPPQPLPEQLPPEIAELFPPEVNALFPDGLPPTQQEAQAILDEAGLFDEVMDVLNEHPEAMDAIQSAQRPASELVASWSADGDEWTPTDIALPDGLGDLSQLVVSGDRLTTAGSIVPQDGVGPWIMTVASTTDLRNWTTRSFEIATPEDLPEGAQVWAHLIAVAADDEHWVARVIVDVAVESLGATQGSQPRVELWSGSWDESSVGEPTIGAEDQAFGLLLATGAGFVDIGEQVAFSPDGQTWTEVNAPQPNLWFQTVAPLGDDLVMIAGTPYGEASIHVLDTADRTWTDIEIPGLEGPFSTWTWASSPAFIIETEMPPPLVQTVVVEHDDFELTLRYGDVAAYQLVDLSNGDIVAEESIGPRTTQAAVDGPFEYLSEDMLGVTVTDPESGAVIVQIPNWVMSEAWDELWEGDNAFETYESDLWLLATPDGEAWLLEDLDDNEFDEPGPQFVATNGSTVLIGSPGWDSGTDVWQRFSLTE